MKYLAIISSIIIILFSSLILNAEPVQKINPEKKTVLGIKKTVHFSWYRQEGVKAYEIIIHRYDENNQWLPPEIKWIQQQNNTSVIMASVKLSNPVNGAIYAWTVRGYKQNSSGKLQTDNESQYNIFTICPPDDTKSGNTGKKLQELKIIVDTKLTNYIAKKIKQFSSSKPIPEILIQKCEKISSQLSKWSEKVGQILKKFKGKMIPSKLKKKYVDELLKTVQQILLKK